MIHKYLAGMIDQYELAGVDQAIDVAMRLADWVDRRTAPLSYAHMQRILDTEYGGLPESLVNLYAITGVATVPDRRRSGSTTRGSLTRSRRARTTWRGSSAT